jgi:predicted 3-demethylubiquinone-9 3-methyltransferase (glyoxalase superfamily)
MPVQVRPFLMFQGQAEDAMGFYISLFPGAAVLDITRYPPAANGEPGKITLARFSIGDQTIMCIDSPVEHEFTFTPAMSLFVTLESGEELRRVYDRLLEGGMALMPLDNYGFSRQFGWVNDRFGVSWQLNLP